MGKDKSEKKEKKRKVEAAASAPPAEDAGVEDTSSVRLLSIDVCAS